MPTMIQLFGHVFGRLTVTSRQPVRTRSGLSWDCRCICGREVSVLGECLRKGRTRSCGCLVLETSRKQGTVNRTHGEGVPGHQTHEYKAWGAMFTRCNNPKAESYHRYGGRGITVCEEWSGPGGYVKFLGDMGRRPSGAHSLERKDTDGNYTPGNCTWATRTEQQRNRSNTRHVTFGLETRPLAEWAEIVGKDLGLLHGRLSKGFSVERALFEPVRQRTSKRQRTTSSTG